MFQSVNYCVTVLLLLTVSNTGVWERRSQPVASMAALMNMKIISNKD